MSTYPQWVKFEGYSETHQLVAADGQIIGEVLGSEFKKTEGWSAFDERTLPSTRIGRYRSLRAAQRAVEAAQRPLEDIIVASTKQPSPTAALSETSTATTTSSSPQKNSHSLDHAELPQTVSEASAVGIAPPIRRLRHAPPVELSGLDSKSRQAGERD